MRVFFGLLASLFLPVLAAADSMPRPKGANRTVMVQLFEWPWDAIGEECEAVLGPAGFAAVQVSPPTEHLKLDASVLGEKFVNSWWERYQPVSYQLTSRSGTEREFARMVQRCRSAGVDVYVDVVLNHMAGMAEGVGFAGTRFTQYEYPGLYSYQDFHHCGRNGNDDIVDFTSLYELLNCELLNLADLDTAKTYVQERQADLLRRLLGFGVAGFRIDAAKHMAAADIEWVFRKVKAPFYVIHELIISPGEPVEVGPYLPLGDVNVFPYAYGVGDAFLSGDLRGLPGLGGFLGVASSEAVVLLENHDLERRSLKEPILSYVQRPELNRLAEVFMLTWPYGYPQLYSGYTFRHYDEGPPLGRHSYVESPGARCRAPWTCAHRSPDTLALVGFRNRTQAEFRASDVVSPEAGVLAYGRGTLGHVVINATGRDVRVAVPTRLPAGGYANLLGEGRVRGVVEKGSLVLTLPAMSAFVVGP